MCKVRFPVKQNDVRRNASKRAWASRKRMKEARELREQARIIHPAGLHEIKAKYKQVAIRTPWQTEMDLKK
jgi:hypothetical protein